MQASMQAQASQPLPGGVSKEAAMLLHQARNAAFAEAAQGRIGRGVSMLQHALNHEPLSHDLLSDIAALMLAAGELSEAADHARQALAVQPEHGPSLYTLGFALSGQGLHDGALQALRKLAFGDALASLLNEAPELLVLARSELLRLEALISGE